MKKLLSILLMVIIAMSLSGCAEDDEEQIEAKVLEHLVYFQIEDACFVTYTSSFGYSGYSGMANIDCDDVGKPITILSTIKYEEE